MVSGFEVHALQRVGGRYGLQRSDKSLRVLELDEFAAAEQSQFASEPLRTFVYPGDHVQLHLYQRCPGNSGLQHKCLETNCNNGQLDARRGRSADRAARVPVRLPTDKPQKLGVVKCEAVVAGGNGSAGRHKARCAGCFALLVGRRTIGSFLFDLRGRFGAIGIYILPNHRSGHSLHICRGNFRVRAGICGNHPLITNSPFSFAPGFVDDI